LAMRVSRSARAWLMLMRDGSKAAERPGSHAGGYGPGCGSATGALLAAAAGSAAPAATAAPTTTRIDLIGRRDLDARTRGLDLAATGQEPVPVHAEFRAQRGEKLGLGGLTTHEPPHGLGVRSGDLAELGEGQVADDLEKTIVEI
jgi:hypothetical protein